MAALRSSVLILLILARADGGCVSGDCKNGHGVYAEGERRYEGEWKDGLQHGRGTFHFAAGEKYEGDWRNGKPNGRGVKTYADGRRYDGEWKDNAKHGRGRLTWADGASYEGDWVSDAYHGHGVLQSAEATYEGAFRAHQFHGQGTKTFADGRKLQGDWKNGEPNFHESARQMPPGLSPEAMDMMEQMRANEEARLARDDL